MNTTIHFSQNIQLARTLPLCYTNSLSSLKLYCTLSRKKSAFTLAETLITLTIIGVIAAMTIPTLMTNYQKQVYVTSLKKVYSQLQQAFRMMPMSENCPAGDFDCTGYFNTGGKGKTEMLAKQFKTVKEAFEYQEAWNDAGCDQVGRIGGHGGATPCFYTADGAIISASNGVYVDVNGLKGPNIWGRDQFFFYVADNPDNSKIPLGTLMPMGSKIYSELWGYSGGYWKTSNYCTSGNIKKNSQIGSWSAGHCTARVLDEGKMNY